MKYILPKQSVSPNTKCTKEETTKSTHYLQDENFTRKSN